MQNENEHRFRTPNINETQTRPVCLENPHCSFIFVQDDYSNATVRDDNILVLDLALLAPLSRFFARANPCLSLSLSLVCL